MADLFVSYAREDQGAIRDLHEALVARGRETWVDWEGIEPSDRWMESIREAIDGADAVLVALSPDLLASSVCKEEIAHAVSYNKRLIPVVVRDVEGDVPDALRDLNWIFARDGIDDLDAAADAIVRALDTELDLVRTHTLVLTRARSWELAGRRASPLLRGDELRRAEDWLARSAAGAQPAPTDLQAAFVAASRAAATRRQRFAVGGSLGVAAVSIALAAFALVSRSQAVQQSHIATSHELSADAASTLSSDPQLSLLLADEALQHSATPAAKLALVTALDRSTLLAVFHLPAGAATAVAWSPGGKYVAIAGQNGSLTLWDPAANKVVRTIVPHGRATDSVAFSPSGAILAAGTADGLITLWDPATARQIAVLRGHKALVAALAFSPDGRYLISGSDDDTARVWDVAKRRLVHVLQHHGAVRGVAIASGDRYVVTAGSTDGYTALWDTSTWKVVRERRPDLQSQAPGQIALSPTGPVVAISSEDGIIRLWNPLTNKAPRLLKGHLGPALVDTFSVDGRYIASGGFDDTARLWDATTGQLVQTYSGTRGLIEGLAFSPDGRRLITASADGTARVWRVGSNLTALQHVLGSHQATQPIVGIAASSSTNMFATGGVDGAVSAWRFGGGKLWSSQSDTGLQTLALAPDGGLLAATSSHGVTLLRSSDGAVVARLAGPDANSVAFSADGSLVAASSASGTVLVWDVRSHRVVHSFPIPKADTGAGAVAIDPRKPLLAVGTGSGEVLLWDLSTGKAAGRLTGPTDAVGGLAFTPDGNELAGASDDQQIWLWRVGSRTVERVFRGHTAAVLGVAISRDGRYLASASEDRTARIWDLRTGAVLRVLTGDDDWVNAVVFSNDGMHIATASLDGTARVWDSCTWCESVSGLLAHARAQLAVRCLTANERQTYLHEPSAKNEACAA